MFGSLPNPHPALVHFPVALLPLALAFDIALVARYRLPWMDRVTAFLYLIGAVGCWAALWSGERAADTFLHLSPEAQRALVEHGDWGHYSLWCFGALAVLRVAASWWERAEERIPLSPLRGVLLAGALACQWVLFETADHGGALVYRHGVGVAVVRSGEGTESAPTAGSPPAREARPVVPSGFRERRRSSTEEQARPEPPSVP